MAQVKTNALRILDKMNIPYSILTYDNKDGKIDGISVANKINRDPKVVYKTLVAQGINKSIFVFILPVEKELDVKKAAKAAGVKNIEMIPVKDIQKLTGYIRGGCSPFGMRKTYPTFIDHSILDKGKIIVSGGKIGLQVEINTEDIVHATEGTIADICKE